MASMAPKSYLDLVNECDAFPYFNPDPTAYIQQLNNYYHLRVQSHPSITLGYLLPSVALTLANLSDWHVSPESDPLPRTVILVTGYDARTRTAAVAKVTQAMREARQFRVLDKWRDELYPVYGPKQELLFVVERSASPLFGIVTYGVHMTVFSRDADGDMSIWVPRRARSKQTYPSMLDNSVAGGIGAGEAPFACLIREAMEEASLPEDVVRARAKPCGAVTYFYVRDERAGGETGLLQPECQYVYDLDLTGVEGVECKPNDDEVEEFIVMSVTQVKEALGTAQFKPNCALVMIDFLVRHGVINRESEPDYTEIIARLHRRLEFPMG